MSATFKENGKIVRNLDYMPGYGDEVYRYAKVKLTTGEYVRLCAEQNGFNIEYWPLSRLPLGIGLNIAIAFNSRPEPDHVERIRLQYIGKDEEGHDGYKSMVATDESWGRLKWKPFEPLQLANGQTVEPSIIYPPEQRVPGKGRGAIWWPT